MNNLYSKTNSGRDSSCSSNDNLESLEPSILDNVQNLPVVIDSIALLNGYDVDVRFSPPQNDFLVLQSQHMQNSLNLEKELRYPKRIDPFKTNHQIIFLSFTIISTFLLFALSFSPRYFIFGEFIEFGICAILCLQFLLMITHYCYTSSWHNFLSDAGFFRFPRKIIFQRTLVFFTWCVGAMLLSPLLVGLNIVCKNDTISCVFMFSKLNLIQIYWGLESLILFLFLLWHLVIVVRFKVQRHWPDIWHERLLEQSPVLNWCPLVKLSELRVASVDDLVTVSHDTVLGPTIQDVMRAQAYMIGYLRKLNGNLGLRMGQMTEQHVAVTEDRGPITLRFEAVESSPISSTCASIHSDERKWQRSRLLS